MNLSLRRVRKKTQIISVKILICDESLSLVQCPQPKLEKPMPMLVLHSSTAFALKDAGELLSCEGHLRGRSICVDVWHKLLLLLKDFPFY